MKFYFLVSINITENGRGNQKTLAALGTQDKDKQNKKATK